MLRIRRLMDTRFATWPINRLLTANPLYARFANGVWWSFIGAVLSQGLTLLASVPVARTLGSVGYGELGIIQSTLALFALFTGTSLGLTATRYVAELEETDPERAGKLIGLTSVTAFVISGILAFLLGFGAPYLSRYVLNATHLSPALRIAALVLFLNGLNGAQTGTLAGFQAFRRIALVNIVRGLVTFPAMLIGVWLWGLLGAVAALAVAAGVGVVITQWALVQETKKNGLVSNYRGGFSEWRVLLSFTLPAILSGIVVVPVTWWANVMLVNQNNGYVEMGIFNATSQWRTALTFLPAVLTQPTLPMLSNLHGIGSFKEYRRLLNLNLGVVSLSTLVPALGISIAAPWIMKAYGFESPTSAVVLILLSLSAVLSASSGVIGSMISSIGKMWHALGLNAIWAAAFIGLFVSREQDALGLAMAYLVSYIIHLFTVSVYAILVLRTKSRPADQTVLHTL